MREIWEWFCPGNWADPGRAAVAGGTSPAGVEALAALVADMVNISGQCTAINRVQSSAGVGMRKGGSRRSRCRAGSHSQGANGGHQGGHQGPYGQERRPVFGGVGIALGVDQQPVALLEAE